MILSVSVFSLLRSIHTITGRIDSISVSRQARTKNVRMSGSNLTQLTWVPDRVPGNFVTFRPAPPFEGRMGEQRRRWRFLPSVLAYGPLLAQVVVTRRCNLACGYCNEYDNSSPPVPTELVKARVDKLASLGLLFCEYTGGETLLHPEIIELVRYASSYRFNERWII